MDKYNGWTNYETWNVNLWMDNTQGDQDYWRERAQESYKTTLADETFSKVQNAALSLMDAIKEQFEANAPELNGPYADLLSAAISSVNWYEIAEALVENVKEEVFIK